MDKKDREKHVDAETENFRLWCYYVFSPFLCGIITVLVAVLYNYIITSDCTQDTEIKKFCLQLGSKFPLVVWLLLDGGILLYKRRYRFPPSAPQATRLSRTARYAWMIHILFDIGLFTLLLT